MFNSKTMPVQLTWLMMKKITVMAAQARVTNIRNLNLKMRPWTVTERT